MMLTTRLYQKGEITSAMLYAIMEDYEEQLPSFRVMLDELKDYDLIDLTFLLTNLRAMRDAATWSMPHMLDEDRTWFQQFCSGWVYALEYSIANCQLLYTH
jgi:hypothetical protein